MDVSDSGLILSQICSPLSALAEADTSSIHRKEKAARRRLLKSNLMIEPAEILAVAHQDIEGVDLHLGIVPAGMQAVEI
jgi:hypothetical protein